jgi:hypothetical protein
MVPEVKVALKALWKAQGKTFPEVKKHKMQTPNGGTVQSSLKTAMSRKDYILIANVLKGAKDPGRDIVMDMARALKSDNPAFNVDHFIAVVNGTKDLNSHPPRKAPSPSRGWAEPPMNVNGSKKPRLAGAKLGGNVTPELVSQAKELIENDDPIIYDVAAETGQIVGNVKHMSWFVREVAEWLAEDAAMAGPAAPPVRV